jgi:hypothetical protein
VWAQRCAHTCVWALQRLIIIPGAISVPKTKPNMDALSVIVLIAGGLILTPFVVTGLQMFRDTKPRDPR